LLEYDLEAARNALRAVARAIRNGNMLKLFVVVELQQLGGD
jgi:hypothetical protein